MIPLSPMPSALCLHLNHCHYFLCLLCCGIVALTTAVVLVEIRKDDTRTPRRVHGGG